MMNLNDQTDIYMGSDFVPDVFTGQIGIGDVATAETAPSNTTETGISNILLAQSANNVPVTAQSAPTTDPATSTTSTGTKILIVLIVAEIAFLIYKRMKK